MTVHGIERAPEERVNWKTSFPFFLVHALLLVNFVTGVTRTAVVLFLVMYWGRMFFITGGYHRYFAHRSYKLGRGMQFLMAFGGGMAAQKGALWWASHHRNHHRYSDTERDLHSPQKGFWWSHVGWILCDKNNDWNADDIRDFEKFPELRFLTKHDWIPPWVAGVSCFLIGGWSGLVFGFITSTVLLWHSTFLVNSLAHVMGRRRYATTDTSRNSALIAFLTLGEGWHNNHHYFQASTRQGFFWWEFDVTYYVLKGLSYVGLVKDMKEPPARVKTAARVRDGSFDSGMFRAHWAKAGAALANVRAHAPHLPHLGGGDGAIDTASVADSRTPAIAGGSLATSAAVLTRAAGTKAEAAQVDEAGTRREQLEELIAANRAALQDHIANAMAHAEELGRLSRRHERQLATATVTAE